jgi:hypothetical protein
MNPITNPNPILVVMTINRDSIMQCSSHSATYRISTTRNGRIK